MAIVLTGFLLPVVFPIVPEASGSGSNLVHMMLLFSLLVGFLINRAIERKQTISSSVAIELSKLRRVYHIGEELARGAARKRLFASLAAYQRTMAKAFLGPVTAKAFRDMTHGVYGLEPRDLREQALFADLLDTTRCIALERQRRETAVEGGLSWYSWLVIAAYAVFIILLLLWNREESGFSAISVGATVTGVLLVLDLLYRLDRFSAEEAAQVMARFARNAPHAGSTKAV